MLMAAAALLAENPRPTEDEIRYGIAGNLCRCTGYTKMVAAITEAAGAHARQGGPLSHGDRDEDDARRQGSRARHPARRRRREGHRAGPVRGRHQAAGLLHAKLLRSPHAHARIVRIDTSRARALPGVRAVLTAADIPELKRKAPTRAHAVLAIDRVVFVGQPVAAVAADELAIAEEALDLIEVEYEVLPAAVDPLQSMQPGAPPVADAGTEADTSEALAHSAVARRRERDDAGQGRQHRAAGATAARRRGQGLRRVRPRPREDVPRAHGPPGLPRAPRRPGPVGHAPGC